eukprot:c28110_g1_i1 orf=488-1669(+)
MEVRDSMGLSPPGTVGVLVSQTGSFGAMLQRSMSSVPGASSPPPTSPTKSAGPHSPPAMRPTSLPLITIASSTSNLNPSPFLPDMSAGIASHPMSASMGMGIERNEPTKRKRGRPRKYGPDGIIALAAVPLSTATMSVTPSQKRGRGRPPGSGRKQQLAAIGGWLAGSAGAGFTPHVITVAAGEDVAARIMSFSQQGPRAICILSANGAISNVTLRQPATSGGTVTYEGRFEILSLSGSFLLTETGGTRSRTGGLSVSLAGPDGRVVGGGVAGLLMAASPVQVVVGSFVSNGKKSKAQPVNAETSVGLMQGSISVPLIMAIPVTCVSMNEVPVANPAGLESPINLAAGMTRESNALQSHDQTMRTFQSGDWLGSHVMLESRQNTDINISLPDG